MPWIDGYRAACSSRPRCHGFCNLHRTQPDSLCAAVRQIVRQQRVMGSASGLFSDRFQPYLAVFRLRSKNPILPASTALYLGLYEKHVPYKGCVAGLVGKCPLSKNSDSRRQVLAQPTCAAGIPLQTQQQHSHVSSGNFLTIPELVFLHIRTREIGNTEACRVERSDERCSGCTLTLHHPMLRFECLPGSSRRLREPDRRTLGLHAGR